MPKGLQRGMLKLGRQAALLEPVHQVVGEQEQMEVRLVGHEVAGGDAAQGVIAFELFDEQFYSGTIVVEAPEVQRLQRQIRDQDLVVILAKLEEGQLLARFFGLGPADDDKAIGPRPPNGLIAELRHVDATAGTHILQMRQLAFDRGRQAGDNHEPSPLRVEPLDQRVVVKPFVRADNHQPDPGRNLPEARRKQVAGSTGRMDIARPQLAMPEVFGPPLEAEQRVVRRPTALDRVVADPCALLIAIDHQDGGVDIEDQPRRPVWSCRHARQEAIVQGAQLRQCRRGHAQQESPQRGRVRIGVQSREVLEHAVLPQQLGRLDALQPEDHRIEQCQQHLADAVAIVPLRHAKLASDLVLEADARQEPMQQIHPAIMRQRRRAKLDRQLSRSPGHGSEGY